MLILNLKKFKKKRYMDLRSGNNHKKLIESYVTRLLIKIATFKRTFKIYE